MSCRALSYLFAFTIIACGGGCDDAPTRGPAADGGIAGDSGRPPDSGSARDAGGPGDSASADDAGLVDRGGSADDAAADVASLDGGSADAAVTDATTADGASPTAAYPARPPAGMIFWGASIGGNGDPVPRHEQPAGHALVLRRTFFQWSHRTGYMINIAKDDLANGRLPWVSIKPPSWAEMAAGQHDAEIDAMLKALAALPGPVWLTVHHEPEGGGGVNTPDDPAGPAGHVAMNEQVRARMTALGVSNVALAPILMSWTWNPSSGRDPEQWWAPGIYDFLGVDHYRDAPESLLTTTWQQVRTWAAGKGVELAVGEWGMRGTDAAAGQRVHDWYDHAAGSHADGQGARVVGLSAFDSGLNSPTGSWELVGEQLVAFHALLKDPRTADVKSLP